MRVLYGRGQTPIGAGLAHRQVVDIRGPTEFIAGIKEMRPTRLDCPEVKAA